MNVKKNINRGEAAEIQVLGLSHKTAPVELREKFALTAENIPEFLYRARCAGITEILYLSTCNRVEIYYTATDMERGSAALWGLLKELSGRHAGDVQEYFYARTARDAVKHCLAVASSLDSMVIGENEILGQFKEAYRIAAESGNTGVVLNRLFHHAFHCAKKVKTDTDIARNPLSIAYIACEQAKKVFDDLSSKTALLIGAGEMGELILKYFTKYEIREIIVANRTRCNAERIVEELNTRADIISLDELSRGLVQADIVISTASSPDFIITGEMMKELGRKRKGRPLFVIDIAVPRNIDPEVISLNDVFLFNIDDLKKIADENLKSRLGEVDRARDIIESSTNDFMQWYEELEIVPVIESIRNTFNTIRDREVNKYRRRKLKHLSDEDFRVIDELTRQIMTKTLHNPIMALKGYQASIRQGDFDCEDLREKTRMIKELFRNEDKT
ncbi:MAG TPA: glutamyl-tRNA reductase [Spirochaetota bacterium]|nr:glutamyl-tRNA reductase [Spirochaetota bacterium]HPI89473.1 glutamyl-tRNA reductase [Spirochaetota bacterium]HPR49330.1 glutamyl-tRNA reductase [Spirochaetota bacterium]